MRKCMISSLGEINFRVRQVIEQFSFHFNDLNSFKSKIYREV